SGAGSQETVPSASPSVLALRVTESLRARGLRLTPLRAARSREPTSAPNDAGTGAAAPPIATPRGSPPEPSAPSPSPASSAPEPTKPLVPTVPTVPTVAPDATKPEQARPTPTPRKPVPQKAAPATAPKQAEPAARKPSTNTQTAQQPTVTPRDDVDTAPPELAPEGNTRDALLYAEVAGAGVFSAGDPGLSPGVDVFAQVRLQPYRATSLSLFGLVPLWQAAVERAPNQADIRTFALGGFADLHTPLWTRFDLSVGLGAAVLLTSIRGRSTLTAPAVTVQDDPQRTAAMLGRLGLTGALTRSLRLSLQLMVGVAVPPLEVRFGNETVATWGRPLAIATLGVELALPWMR
ncbi:MAG: hypothetical protein ABW321_00565, partial [Polyangiales bacterium]